MRHTIRMSIYIIIIIIIKKGFLFEWKIYLYTLAEFMYLVIYNFLVN